MSDQQALETQAERLAACVRARDWWGAQAALRDLESGIRELQEEVRTEHIRGRRDGRWWQLYTSAPELKAEVKAATKDLNAAMDEALARIAREPRGDLARSLGLDPAQARNSELADRLLHRHLRPVMSLHAKAGADDSEPRDAALDALEDALARRVHEMEAFSPSPSPVLSR